MKTIVSKRIIILDRDGVINFDSTEYIKSVAEWRPIPGALQAITRLCQQNYKIVIATNQSGLARGLYDMQTLHQIHNHMRQALAVYGGSIDTIYFCPHLPDENCICRKPKPGMLLSIQERFAIDLKQVIMVGDSLTDMAAAKAAGAQPVYLLSGKNEFALEADGEIPVAEYQTVPVYQDLAAFVEHHLNQD